MGTTYDEHNARSGDPERFAWAIAFHEATLRSRKDLPVEVVDSAYDGLVDALIRRPDLGETKAAVFALGRNQLGWRIADGLKATRTPEGELRNVPANARSLEALSKSVEVRGDGGLSFAERTADPSAPDPCDLLISREEFEVMLETARRGDAELAVGLVMKMAGFTDDEIADDLGSRANTIAVRRSRFKQAWRDAQDGELS